jgi:DNA polymerase/3'-5' exonuclease PolX
MPEIFDIHDISDTWGIGKSLIEKIDEILKTGRLKKLENYLKEPKINILISFCKIWGVGPSKALELYKKGFLSISQLRESGKDELNNQQQIGLVYYEDLLQKIPREEVTLIEK